VVAAAVGLEDHLRPWPGEVGADHRLAVVEVDPELRTWRGKTGVAQITASIRSPISPSVSVLPAVCSGGDAVDELAPASKLLRNWNVRRPRYA
jgi:hypothetical protein